MGLGQLVLTEIQHIVARRPQTVDGLLPIRIGGGLKAHEDTGRISTNAVGKLRDVARENETVEVDKSSWFFRNINCDVRLGGICSFRHEAQPIEIHVGTTAHSRSPLSA